MINRLRSCFSAEKVNTGRQGELDIVKGLAIIFMIWCHVYRELGADTTSFGGMMVDSILGGPFAAPMFMISMGVGICYSRKNTPEQFFKRGGLLLLLGYGLNVARFVIPQIVVSLILGSQVFTEELLSDFMQVDILQFAGCAFILIGLAKKFKFPGYILPTLAIFMSVAGVLLKDKGTGVLLADLILSLFWKTQSSAYFTLFHWFIFPVAGMFLGELLLRCKDKKKMYKCLIPICLPIGLAAEGVALLFGISLLDTFTEYFYMTLIDAVFLICLFICWSGLHYLLHEKFSNVSILLMQRMSRDINSIFCIHWVILGILCAVKTLTLPELVPGFLPVTFVAIVVGFVSILIAGKVRWHI